MTGNCYIDGRDIYTDFGIIVEGDGYDELFSFPTRVEPDKNDWAEEHGIEPDLSNPLLQAQEITIDFALLDGRRWQSFYAFLAEPGYRTINIPALGRTWMLRVVEMPELDMYDEADIFSVKFAEDVREVPSGYPAANAGGLLASVVSLDGKSLDKYGIIVTTGLEEFERAPKLKKALTRTNSLQNGQVYDTDFVRYVEKEVTFGCCLNGIQATDFWNLYDAFFGDLLKTGTRKIGYGGKEYSAFYRKTGNWKLHSHNGGMVCEFDLTFCFTAFSVGGELCLLAAENNYLITTEDGIFIDLRY